MTTIDRVMDRDQNRGEVEHDQSEVPDVLGGGVGGGDLDRLRRRAEAVLTEPRIRPRPGRPW